MQPAFRALALVDPALGRRAVGHAALTCLAMWGALGCGPRDAQVGAAAPRDAAADTATPLFSSQLTSNGGLWNVQAILAGASAQFGVGNAGASDGLVAELRFPGNATLGATDAVGPANATEISTKQYFRFGTFRTRLQFASCASSEEIASAVFMYFNDGSDGNANGIADNPELDFQLLCGTPTFIVLTAWADYQRATDGTETFLKLSHAVDTATGDFYDTPSPSQRPFAKTGNDPALIEAGFPAPGAFYEVGIEWQPARVRFFIVRGGAEVTLWEVTDTAYVPKVPLPLMYNLWHSETHWVPQTTPADYPANDGVMNVDWAQFFAP